MDDLSNRIRSFTMLMWPLLNRLDRGEVLDPRDVRSRIVDGSIINWLAEVHGFDVSFIAGPGRLEAHEVVEVFQQLEAVGLSGLGVGRNGLTILLACCTEGIQQTLPTGE